MPSTTTNDKIKSYPFLAGGGEMGLLTRTKDWAQTSLGSPNSWPQSLRTTLSIILNSKFPMFLWWGPELICFYNDAYRPSLGQNGKHPDILGMKAEYAWEEIWDIIKPLIDQVLQGRGSTWSEDQLIPIFRNGKIENVYWTFSYSPVNDESGKTNGVLVTCNETTEKVNLLAEIKESKEQLEFAIDATELGTWDYNPLTNKLKANARMKEWFGLSATQEITLEMVIDAVSPGDRERVKTEIKKTLEFDLGGKYEISYSIIHPVTREERIVRAKGSASFNNEKRAYRFNGTLQDITAWVLAKRATEESERRFRNIVKQAPLGITIIRSREFVVEMANSTYLDIVDKGEDEFVGMPLFQSLPETEEVVAPLLTDVFNSGKPYYGIEFPVKINRHGKEALSYFNFVYHPLSEDDADSSRIIVVASDVTATVKAKHVLAESERQFRNLVMQSPIPMTILMGEDHVIGMANNKMFQDIWRKKEDEVLGKKLLDVFPELGSQKYSALLNEVFTSGKIHREEESVAYVNGDDGLRKFYFDFEYAPLFETDGSISGIIATVSDVTEKVEAHRIVEDAEERLRLAAEATELATWDLELQRQELICSPRLAEIFGRDPSKEMKFAELRSQLHVDDLDKIVKPAFEEALKTSLYKYEARIIRPDNKIRWIRIQGKVLFDEEKNPQKLIGTLRDVTEEKQHEQELLESEQKFRLLADSMPQYIWTSGPDGKLNYFNKSVFEFSGLTAEEIVQDGWMEMIHPDDREQNMKEWMEAVESGKDFLFEHRFRRYDGEYRWQLSRAKPQRDAQGNIQMWVGTSTDIQQIKEMDQQKDLFISMASHELKTPITSIRGYAQVLQLMYKDSNDAVLTKSLNSIDKQVERLTHLIADLLDLSKIKSGKLFLNRESFEMKDLVEEVVDEIKHINPQYSISILNKPAARVYADKERIGQVLVNFLTNAVKYSPDSKEVKVDCKLEENMVVVSVSDSGIGINKNDQAKIFERFYRVEGKNEKTFPGFGIGLFISLEIMHRHGGEIGVTSEPGKGSVFHFSLPLEKRKAGMPG